MIALAMLGCSSPASRFDDHAVSSGLRRNPQHDLVVYQKGRLVDGEPLHIYLDGDGTPITRTGHATQDPTSRTRLILDLIRRDSGPALLVGRPCYYGTAQNCDPSDWTTGRYSRAIVERMVDVINDVLRPYRRSPVILIGYSGGGTIAMLAAPALARVDALITIAANLDIDAWIEHHRYHPLKDSLNPARQPPLPPNIQQLHLVGEQDKVVPANIMRHVVAKQSPARLWIVPGFDHRCCWAEMWHEIIQAIDAARLLRLPRASEHR